MFVNVSDECIYRCTCSHKEKEKAYMYVCMYICIDMQRVMCIIHVYTIQYVHISSALSSEKRNFGRRREKSEEKGEERKEGKNEKMKEKMDEKHKKIEEKMALPL